MTSTSATAALLGLSQLLTMRITVCVFSALKSEASPALKAPVITLLSWGASATCSGSCT